MPKTSATSGADYILCPFFRAHSHTEIVCESDLPGAKTHNTFRTAQDKKFQQNVFCEKEYKRCPHYVSCCHWHWEIEDDEQ